MCYSKRMSNINRFCPIDDLLERDKPIIPIVLVVVLSLLCDINRSYCLYCVQEMLNLYWVYVNSISDFCCRLLWCWCGVWKQSFLLDSYLCCVDRQAVYGHTLVTISLVKLVSRGVLFVFIVFLSFCQYTGCVTPLVYPIHSLEKDSSLSCGCIFYLHVLFLRTGTSEPCNSNQSGYSALH